jgi:glyoxylase-like metal-dependent hydrolase (beta-lactamase superfamily II)
VSTLTWWFSPHPEWEPGEDWPEEVPVVCLETADEIVVIDPFLPPDGSFDPGDKPVRVLLTQGAHHRGTPNFVERYGASVWAPPRAWWPPKLANPATTEELPPGIEAFEPDGEPQQVLFWIPEHATLVSGDVLTGRDGVVVFVDEADREPLLASLERIAELPIEQLIRPHGEPPVVLDGAAAIRAGVAAARAAT